MSKSTNADLQSMAMSVLYDYNTGGSDSVDVIMTVSNRCGIHPNDVFNRIRYYAKLEV